MGHHKPKRNSMAQETCNQVTGILTCTGQELLAKFQNNDTEQERTVEIEIPTGSILVYNGQDVFQFSEDKGGNLDKCKVRLPKNR